MLFLWGPSLLKIYMRRQGMKCLHCPVLQFNFIRFFYFLNVCLLQQVSYNNVAAAATCSLRMWRWQMSNYRSDIHVSHLWPAWPTISPTDAECEMRELSLSTQAPGKAAWPILACHPSLVPLGCHSCVTVPLSLTDRWPHWGRTSRMIKYLSGIKDNHRVSLTRQRTKRKNPLSYISFAVVTSLSISNI